MVVGKAAVQRDPDKIKKKGVDRNLTTFNKNKVTVQHVGWNNCRHQYRLVTNDWKADLQKNTSWWSTNSTCVCICSLLHMGGCWADRGRLFWEVLRERVKMTAASSDKATVKKNFAREGGHGKKLCHLQPWLPSELNCTTILSRGLARRPPEIPF